MVERTQALAAAIRKDPDVALVMANAGGGNAANTQNAGRLFITLRDKPERTDSIQVVISRLRRLAARFRASRSSSCRSSRSMSARCRAGRSTSTR